MYMSLTGSNKIYPSLSCSNEVTNLISALPYIPSN